MHAALQCTNDWVGDKAAISMWSNLRSDNLRINRSFFRHLHNFFSVCMLVSKGSIRFLIPFFPDQLNKNSFSTQQTKHALVVCFIDFIGNILIQIWWKTTTWKWIQTATDVSLHLLCCCWEIWNAVAKCQIIRMHEGTQKWIEKKEKWNPLKLTWEWTLNTSKRHERRQRQYANRINWINYSAPVVWLKMDTEFQPKL